MNLMMSDSLSLVDNVIDIKKNTG